MLDLSLGIGIIGMIFILSAFVGDLFKKITEDYVSYNIINIVGAVFLAYYAYSLASFPFLVLQLVWAGCSAYKLASLRKKITG